MKLSVCIAAWQAEKYLAEALESVLAEVPSGTEIIVVDDGSTDGTAAIAQRYGVTTIVAPHRGIGATFNAAVAASSGDLVAAIDADDVWLPGKLAVQLPVLENDPSVDLVFGYVREFLSPDVPDADRERWVVRNEPIPGYLRGTLVIRRDALMRVGPLRDDLQVGEFVDWCARVRAAKLREVMVPDVVLARRIHGGNISIKAAAPREDFLKLVKAKLDRQRGRAGAEEA